MRIFFIYNMVQAGILILLGISNVVAINNDAVNSQGLFIENKGENHSNFKLIICHCMF
jgi:hypothetical protein